MTDSNPTSVFSLENSGTGILRDVTLIKKYGWTQHSIVSWGILSRYWLVNAYYCKDFSNSNEHEFIIYEFVDEHKKELILRSDRNVGAPIDTPTSPPLSHSFSSYSSDMSSDRYLARDTIRIERRPRHHEALKTITFRGDRSSRPSLWDVVVLVWLLHNNRPFYNPLLHQCYWFADTIFGILEKWPNGMAAHGEKGKVKQGRRHASIGCYHGTRVHNRNMEVIVKVWDDFEKERQVLTQKMKEYEQERTETEAMKRQIKQLKFELDQEKSNKRREERLRQVNEETEERNRRNENYKLKQEIAALRLELQQKDRALQMHP